ncbi:MAG: type II toxin-antitoxin system prevent-host-death family antitoxin [Acidimicrobiia bacterium]|nr:type II toxin-antitoxin system prevent-host-death family antitoxin [Acidimicrobiia bacterium]
MTTVNIHEAKTHLSRLLERVEAGERIVIARRGKPIAQLGPLGPPQTRQPGLLQGELAGDLFEPLPPEELDAWER